MPTKEYKFVEVLEKAKVALESIGISFHLHAGTALGCHREKAFIKHDQDIDLAVFYKEVNTIQQVKEIKEAMIENGFEIQSDLGKITRGKEIQFNYVKYDISLDIFWVYDGEYRGHKYFILSSYFGPCDKLKYKTCVWGYEPYKTVRKMFYGKFYNVVPVKTLVNMYGKNWTTPIKFDYEKGIDEGGYKGFIPDYYEPKNPDKKLAFCFLLKEYVKHGKEWSTFFNEDKYFVKSYNIYSHIKEVSDKTQPWLLKNRVSTIKTAWCEESLVKAYIKMLRKAYENNDNKYFILISDECIPLYNYFDTYKKIVRSSKSRVNIDYNAESFVDCGLYYADQWTLLNRYCVKLLLKLYDTDAGKSFLKQIRKDIVQPDGTTFCPDEIFPINWFIHKLGKPTSSKFRKYIQVKPMTYTYWDGVHTSPIKFTSTKSEKFKNKFCESGALFVRKTNNKAAREISEKCS